MKRTGLLLCIACTLGAADLEQITTTDGRHLVGTYDDVNGVLVLDGPGTVTINLKPSQVKDRTPYVRLPPAEKPVAKEAPKEKPAPSVPSKPYVLAPIPPAIVAAQKESQAMTDAAVALELNAIIKWLSSRDLSDVPLPVLSADPRTSERDALNTVQSYNQGLKSLRLIIQNAANAKTAEDRASVVREFRRIQRAEEKFISEGR
jgi:hypothetical protein